MKLPRVARTLFWGCVFSGFLINSPILADLVESYDPPFATDANGSVPMGSSLISGYCFNDLNNNAVWEPWEHRLINVHIRLEKLDQEGQAEAIYDAWTDRYGRYLFEYLPEGTYSILKLGTNEFFNDGQQVLGMEGAPDWMRGQIVNGGQDGIDKFVGIVLTPETSANGYLFASWGLRPGRISKAHFALGYYFIPEPSAALLSGLGLVALASVRVRRNRIQG